MKVPVRLLFFYRYAFTFGAPLVLSVIDGSLLPVWAAAQIMTGFDLDYRLRVMYDDPDDRTVIRFVILFAIVGFSILAATFALGVFHPVFVPASLTPALSLSLHFLRRSGRAEWMALWEFFYFPMVFVALLAPFVPGLVLVIAVTSAAFYVLLFRNVLGNGGPTQRGRALGMGFDPIYLTYRFCDYAIYAYCLLAASQENYAAYLLIQLVGFSRSVVTIFGAFLRNYLQDDLDTVARAAVRYRWWLFGAGLMASLSVFVVSIWALPIAIGLLWLLNVDLHVREGKFSWTVLLYTGIAVAAALALQQPLYFFLFFSLCLATGRMVRPVS